MGKNEKKAAEEKNTQNLTAEELKLRQEQRKRAKKKKRKKMIKIAIAILLAALVLLAVIIYFLVIKSAEKAANQLTAYSVTTRTIEEVLSASGTLMPLEEYNVSATVKGDVLEANFQEGDVVQKDQVLYVVDSSSMESSKNRSETAYKNALEALDDLIEERDDLTLYSKYGGTVTEVYFEVGDTVRVNDVIADVVDDTVMLVDLPFHEADALSMNEGDAVYVHITAAGETVNGVVSEISGLTRTSSLGARTRAVTIKVQNPGKTIVPGDLATAVLASDSDVTTTDSAKFYYNTEEKILADYAGEIESLFVREGNTVKKGTRILKIDGEDLEDRIENARDNLESAQDNLKDTNDNIEKFIITAPITGTVASKAYNAGESIDVTGGSQVAAVILDLSALTFDMAIDELDIFSIQVGQAVTVTSESFPGKAFRGEVTKKSILGSMSNGTTTYPVTVTIKDEEALSTLLPYMNVDAEIIISKTENVLAVPTGAVQRGGTVKVIKNPDAVRKADQESKGSEGRPAGNFGGNNMSQMYLVSPDIECDTVRVQTGVSDDDYIQVVSGLEEGDIVIVQQKQASSFMEMMSGMAHGQGGPGMSGPPFGGMNGGNMGGNRQGGGNMGGNRQGGR